MVTRLRFSAIAAILFAVSTAALGSGHVTVAAVSGNVVVERLGTQLALATGDTLEQRDVISVPGGASLSLDMIEGDSVDIAGDTSIAIETLPELEHVADGKTILSLDHGFMRVLRPRSDDAPLPFYVFFGDERAALAEGEYFFERGAELLQSCAASGQAALAPTQFLPARTLPPSSCYRVAGGDGPPHLQHLHDGHFWEAMRERSGIAAELAAADAPVPLASEAAAPTPAQDLAPIGMPAPADAVPMSSGALLPVAPAVPAAAPVASSLPTPATIWSVNLASYGTEERAAGDVQRLTAAGYRSADEMVEVNGIPRYRVQLRGYSTSDAARAAAGEVSEKFGYREFFLLHTP